MIVVQFQFKPIFSITLENNYFKDNILRNYTVRPTSKTEKLLYSLGLLFKCNEDGVHVLADNTNPEQLSMRLDKLKESKEKLVFLLYIKDSIFKNYTEVPFDTVGKLFYFSNKELGNAKTGKLHVNDYVSKDDLFELAENQTLVGLDNVLVPQNEKGFPIGLIDIELGSEVIDLYNDNLMDNELISFEYKISFNSRSVKWKYIVVPGYSKKLKGLKVVPQNGNEEIKFSEAQKIIIQKDKEVLMFESDVPVKFQETYDFGFQLKRGDGNGGGKTIVKKLNSAALDQLKPFDKNKPDEYCSEIFIYI